MNSDRSPERFPGRYADQVVLVTGGAQGLGRAMVRRFASEGARVHFVDVNPDAGAEVLDSLDGNGHAYRQVDITDAAATRIWVDDVAANEGRIDVLVNNAGVSGVEAPFLELSTEAWDRIFAVNLRAPFLISRWVARHMVERGGGGVILHNASIAALATDGPFAHYSAAKAGLLALTRSMAVELAPHRIRVNAVSPGYTRTEMTTQFFDPATIDHLTRDFARGPLRRLVEPAEVAAAFAWLASDEASGTTGANLVVDGGLTANLYILESLPTA